MAVATRTRKCTEAEYLEIERAAEYKSEFYHGEMFAMAGGSPRHGLIALNIGAELRALLKERPCIPYNSDVRIKVEETGLMTYPDVSVICGPTKFAEGTNDTIVNPVLIVEVLSDSTEAYDRGTKFDHYRRIRSLKEYLLVSQKTPQVTSFARQQDGSWSMIEALAIESEIELRSLGKTLLLKEVYARVDFEPAPFK